MYLDKVAELAFFTEMSDIADVGAHTSMFTSLDKIAEMDKEARKRNGNPILNIRAAKKRDKKDLSKYFSRLAKTGRK